jgi:putative transposase
MAVTISPATGRRYGVTRVCQAWQVPRSSYYAASQATNAEAKSGPAPRRGPKHSIADAELLGAIQADLARSPWSGEGHRKVWARLRTQDGIRVARKRVLRLMRSTTCSRRTASVPGRRRSTTAGSSPTRQT